MMQDQQPRSTSTFDYVVVGTGAAGSIVAARLSEDPGITVCALESGPPDRHPYIHIPAGFIKIMFNEAYTWQFKTEPSPSVNGRSVIIPVGRTVGGSSSINGMIINRGQADDFNNWAQRGNAGWGYADLLPYFKRFERRIGDGDDLYRGRDGNIPVTDLDWPHEICEAFIAGADGLGIPAQRRLQRRVAARRRLSAALHPQGAAPQRRAGCICCRRRRSPGGSTFAPMRAPSRSCSRAGRRWRFAMSTSAAGPSTR